MSYVEKTSIEVTIQPPRKDANGWPRVAAYIREGRLSFIGIDKWGFSDEGGKIPPGHEGMSRAEFEHFSKSVLAGFDVYDAASLQKEQLSRVQTGTDGV